MTEMEKESVSKMLRAVLQTHKNGVELSRVQTEYKNLTGEVIPFKQLGCPSLDSFLKSIPSVVRMDFSRTGEVLCFASVCEETAHIAKLVARQRSSKKKSGRPVKCQMRLKHPTTTSALLLGKPKGTLRQPESIGQPGREVLKAYAASAKGKGNINGTWGLCTDGISNTGRSVAPGVLRRDIPLHRQIPTPANRFDRRSTLPPRFQRPIQVCLSKNLQSNENGNWPEEIVSGRKVVAAPDKMYLQLIQCRLKEVLVKYKEGIFMSSFPQVYRQIYGHDLNVGVLKHFKDWTHICSVEKLPSGEELLKHTAKNVQNKVKNNPERIHTDKEEQLSVDISQKVAKLLTKYSSGLWAKALPKVFEETYKAKFPGHILDNLDLLSSVCNVVYPSADSPKNAILYEKTEQSDENLSPNGQDSGEKVLKLGVRECTRHEETLSSSGSAHVIPPPLMIPQDESPSVLIVELTTTNDVVIRYVGKDYSGAQELMEDEMKDYYKQDNTEMLLQSLAAKQLVAASAEEETWLRGEVVSIEQEQVKVYYVDYGFSEVLEKKKLRKLCSQFYSLPFQATKCKLAGLEAFCDNPAVVKAFETIACGKILLVEILERSTVPLVVLYDTSGDDDVNVNNVCLKALQDKSLEVNLKIYSCYTHVKVTCVNSSGTIYCQISSKGLTKLTETLERVNQYFISRPVTSEHFLSVPFCGKWCLLFHEGKWVRVEITNIHSSRAVDVQFLDSGAVASVKVSNVREIPFLFLCELIEIPPQVVKCCLADLPFSISMWTPNAILWLREAVMNTSDCSLKVMKVEESKRLVHIYLFSPKSSPNADRSINQQISNADLWTHQKDVNLSSDTSTSSIHSKNINCFTTELPDEISKKNLNSILPLSLVESTNATVCPEIPPLFPLPKTGEQMDVYVSVACHPGHFVLQPWQELYRLEVLMEDMILHYNTREEKPVPLEKNKIYAAKVDKKWHRVLVKGLLTNGLVSVYQLDYGRHELVSYENIQPLTGKFRMLPFQAITAQLAGVEHGQWSEEASILFRNNVENKSLVAVIHQVHEGMHAWDRKMVTFLVDTSLPDTDIWIHDLMSEYLVGISF